jgi:hypothetical protein
MLLLLKSKELIFKIMNYKRKRAKAQRAGCLLCKPHKLTANVKADRAKANKLAFKNEDKAY